MIKVIELFAGIGALRQALKKTKIDHEVVAISEIDKYALLAYEKLNIHVYVNKCKFYIVEYIREVEQEGFIGDVGDGMFTFQKVMNK